MQIGRIVFINKIAFKVDGTIITACKMITKIRFAKVTVFSHNVFKKEKKNDPQVVYEFLSVRKTLRNLVMCCMQYISGGLITSVNINLTRLVFIILILYASN